MNKVLLTCVPVYILCHLVPHLAGSSDEKTLQQPTLRHNETAEDLERIKAEILFKSLFRRKRAEQVDAVKTILNFGRYEKQYKMISVMLQKMFDVISSAKTIIESSDYIPASSFPQNDTVKEALSQILENTAFFGELRLKLPDITDLLISKNRDWYFLITWSIGFSNSTLLYDSKTEELIHLLAQEMNLIEREPNFVNPYRVQTIQLPTAGNTESKITKKKKTSSRGPRMKKHTHSEL